MNSELFDGRTVPFVCEFVEVLTTSFDPGCARAIRKSRERNLNYEIGRLDKSNERQAVSCMRTSHLVWDIGRWSGGLLHES